MHLIVGLGNYGKKYQFTRHNFGFLLADQIIADYNLQNNGLKFNSEFFSGKIANKNVILIKPQTFMNLSGNAVRDCMNFYKINLANLIVLHDELDLELGRIKIKTAGGNAGHNGLKSISEMVGNEYLRIRLGISRPINLQFDIADYVLSKFNDDELKIVEQVNKKISQEIPLIINKEFING